MTAPARTMDEEWTNLVGMLPEGWTLMGLYSSYRHPGRYVAHIQGPKRRHDYYGDDAVSPAVALASLASKVPAILAGERAGIK